MSLLRLSQKKAVVLTLVEVTVAMLLEVVDVAGPVAAGRTLTLTAATHTHIQHPSSELRHNTVCKHQIGHGYIMISKVTAQQSSQVNDVDRCMLR